MNHNPFRKSYHLWFVGCTSTEFTWIHTMATLWLLPAKQISFDIIWYYERISLGMGYTMVYHGIPWHKSPEWQFERVFPLGFGCFGGCPKLSDISRHHHPKGDGKTFLWLRFVLIIGLGVAFDGALKSILNPHFFESAVWNYPPEVQEMAETRTNIQQRLVVL